MKVTKEPMEVLKCHECQKSFSNKKTLGDHIRHTHNKEKEKNKKCDSCPFMTHKTYNLKMHKKIHEKETLDPISLSECAECSCL